MNNTPVSNRMHISIFGRRNAGKSTLINALTNQEIALVSDVAGTTTDPVYKTMEILPIGPVVIIDTAGIDDVGNLGELRIKKTKDILRKTDFAIYVVSLEDGILQEDIDFIQEIKKNKKINIVIVLNKVDINNINDEDVKEKMKELKTPIVKISSKNKTGIEELKDLIKKHAKFDESDLNLVGDLIKPSDLVVLVTPIDKSAPKGRLILPQQQTIRDIIENDAIAIITKEHELSETLESLKRKPALVITDSQAFLKVSADTPNDIKMTSFSILFARFKGDLLQMLKGIEAIKSLKENSRILIVEGCTHHRQSDDIGTVKIPRWIRQIVGGELHFEWASGCNFPENIDEFNAIIHCGGCMLNKQEMNFRLQIAENKKIHITNYGILIAYVQGILERALKPFPAAYNYYRNNMENVKDDSL